MRCPNCGWPNKPGATNCSKCQSPLVADTNSDINSTRQEMPLPPGSNGQGIPPIPSSQEPENLKKTVREADIFGPAQPTPQVPPTPQMPPVPPTGDQEPQGSQCPRCGYMLRPGIEKCPNCNFVLRQQAPNPYMTTPATAPASNPSAFRRPTRVTGAPDIEEPTPEAPQRQYFDPHQQAQNPYTAPQNPWTAPQKKNRGTINPYMMQMEEEGPVFSLTAVKRMGERHTPGEREYDGTEVVLNRANTEPDNGSITSREQAVITNVDGRWFIEDRSEQKTTFVQAGHKVELHDGDIILIGNRLFTFKSIS